MAERSTLQIVSDNIFDRIKTLREQRVEGGVPFGFEQVDRRTARNRFDSLSPEAKKNMIGKLGIDNVLKFLGDNK